MQKEINENNSFVILRLIHIAASINSTFAFIAK